MFFFLCYGLTNLVVANVPVQKMKKTLMTVITMMNIYFDADNECTKPATNRTKQEIYAFD